MVGEVVAKYEGHTYDIPDLWVAGFMMQHPGLTIPEVVVWWHTQEQWAEQERPS